MGDAQSEAEGEVPAPLDEGDDHPAVPVAQLARELLIVVGVSADLPVVDPKKDNICLYIICTIAPPVRHPPQPEGVDDADDAAGAASIERGYEILSIDATALGRREAREIAQAISKQLQGGGPERVGVYRVLANQLIGEGLANEMPIVVIKGGQFHVKFDKKTRQRSET